MTTSPRTRSPAGNSVGPGPQAGMPAAVGQFRELVFESDSGVHVDRWRRIGREWMRRVQMAREIDA